MHVTEWETLDSKSSGHFKITYICSMHSKFVNFSSVTLTLPCFLANILVQHNRTWGVDLFKNIISLKIRILVTRKQIIGLVSRGIFEIAIPTAFGGPSTKALNQQVQSTNF